MALRMFSSSIPAPITMMRKPGRAAFRVATTSNKFEPIWDPRSTRSMFCWAPASDKEVELSSKSDSEPRQARNPTNRKGSLSITATRMGCIVGREALIRDSPFDYDSCTGAWTALRYERPCGKDSRKKLWRREWDSNPRYPLRYTRFPSVRLQPLGHLSGEAGGFIIAVRAEEDGGGR